MQVVNFKELLNCLRYYKTLKNPISWQCISLENGGLQELCKTSCGGNLSKRVASETGVVFSDVVYLNP